MQKRLAIFLPSLAGGGAEKSMLKLAIGIAERGYQVDLVLARAEGPYRTYLTTLPECLHVVDLKAPGFVEFASSHKLSAALTPGRLTVYSGLCKHCSAMGAIPGSRTQNSSGE